MIDTNKKLATVNDFFENSEHFMGARIASLVMPNTVAVERVEV